MFQLNKPAQINAYYRITTPVFSGGANQSVDATQFRNTFYKAP